MPQDNTSSRRGEQRQGRTKSTPSSPRMPSTANVPPSPRTQPTSSSRKPREDSRLDEDPSSPRRQRSGSRQASAPPSMEGRNSFQGNLTDFAGPSSARGASREAARRNSIAEAIAGGRETTSKRRSRTSPPMSQSSNSPQNLNASDKRRLQEVNFRSDGSSVASWIVQGRKREGVEDPWESTGHAVYKAPIPKAYSSMRTTHSSPVSSGGVIECLRDGSWGKKVPGDTQNQPIYETENTRCFKAQRTLGRSGLYGEQVEQARAVPNGLISPGLYSDAISPYGLERTWRTDAEDEPPPSPVRSRGSSLVMMPKMAPSPAPSKSKGRQQATTGKRRSGSAPPLRAPNGLPSNTSNAQPNDATLRPQTPEPQPIQQQLELQVQLPQDEELLPSQQLTPQQELKMTFMQQKVQQNQKQCVLASNAGVSGLPVGSVWTPLTRGALSGDWSWTPRPGFKAELYHPKGLRSPAWKRFHTSKLSSALVSAPTTPVYPV